EIELVNRHALPEHASARILVVDDHEGSVQVLERLLRSAGYSEIVGLTDSRKVLPTFLDFDPDLIILDVRMPHLDGFAVLRQIQPRSASRFRPVLMITGDTDVSVKEQALATGAADFLHKPFESAEVILRLRNLLRMRFFTTRLEQEVAERTAALRRSEVEIAHRLALAAELRDYAGGEHTQRVGNTSALLAESLGLPHDEVETIRLAATLHDIGKIAIPDTILLKNGSLTLDEFDVLKQHTTIGARMLAGSSSQILQKAEEIALYHHENWNGTGYTPGLQEEMIPLAARLVRVADVFDALTHSRPYKHAWTLDDAVTYIGEQAGIIFDPQIVEIFVRRQATEGLPTLPDDTLPLMRDQEWTDLSGLLATYEPLDEQSVITDGHA
ncbi:MAG TPA: HD domain-containing phosphohydrolase, partial [Longimicrobiales bacterium]